jgi:hypothetical protein
VGCCTNLVYFGCRAVDDRTSYLDSVDSVRKFGSVGWAPVVAVVAVAVVVGRRFVD